MHRELAHGVPGVERGISRWVGPIGYRDLAVLTWEREFALIRYELDDPH